MLLVFLAYAAIGAISGWSLSALAGLSLPIAVLGGIAVTLVLSQLHLFLFRGSAEDYETNSRLENLEDGQRRLEIRQDEADIRAGELDTRIDKEITERRDVFVSEMRQLEGLIDKLAQSFESRLGEQRPSEPIEPRQGEILRTVQAALEDGRVDLHLQPVVSLPQRRVGFYEGFTRLRRPDGRLILPAEFLDAAREAGLIGAIDNMLLFRCVQIVRRLAQRDRRVGVFCNISAHSLEDDQFFPHFLSFMREHRDLAGALIFEIRADGFARRSEMMRASMEKLAALGFRFSLDHAEDLNFDMARLQEAGVRFVKMNGETLTTELRDPSGSRPASSVNRYVGGDEVAAIFSRYGVTLVAEKLEEEANVVDVLEFGIAYGQGHIFGEPKPIKPSLMQETAPPADFIKRIRAAG